MDKVSIIIPVYNGEKYVAETIESCLNQNYSDYEIIIVNDGSTDKTENIISGYAQQYPDKIVVIHKENGGTASALNIGMEMMKGDWFKWISADDVMLPNVLSKIMSYIQSLKIDEKFKYMYYTDYDIIDENGEKTKTFSEPDRSKMTQEERAAEQFKNFYGNGSASMFHRTALHLVGKFKEGLPYFEDYEYWVRWGLKFKFDYWHIPIVSIQYRVHSASLTNTGRYADQQLLRERFRMEYHHYLSDSQKKWLDDNKPKLARRIARHLPPRLVTFLLGVKNR